MVFTLLLLSSQLVTRLPHFTFMLFIFLLHLVLSYQQIPEQFKLLKQKAQQSEMKRKSARFEDEEPLYPGQPYISDTFNGTVSSMVFGTTVSALKGYAIDDDNHYMALISNRKSFHGSNMISQSGIFFDKESQKIFKLHESIVDDGDVAIYNITEMEFLDVFDRFRLVLPAFSTDYSCSSAAEGFGGVCKARCLYNWDDIEDVAKEVEIPGVPDEFKKNVHVYAGAMGTAEASVVVSKTGVMSLQAQLVGDIVLKGGAGFHVKKYKWSKDIIELGEIPIKIIDYSKYFFGLSFNIKLDILLAAYLENFKFEIPHDINYMKEFRAELKSGITVSNKEKTLTDFDKSFIIYDAVTRSKKLDDRGDIDASLSTSLVLKAGFSLKLKASSSDFHIETGLKNKFNLDYKVDIVKCTFPPLSGTFNYQLLAYIDFGGTLRILNHQIWSNKYYFDKKLFEKMITDGSCIFSPDSSDEVNPDLVDNTDKQLTLYRLSDVAFTEEGAELRPIFMMNNYQDDIFLLKPIYQTNRNDITSIILHNNQQFDTFDLLLFVFKGEQVIQTEFSENVTLPVDSKLSYSYLEGKFKFDMERTVTSPRDMFKEFKFSVGDVVNSKPTEYYERNEKMEVIIHSPDTSYIVDHSLYDAFCESEIEPFDSDIPIRTWYKLEITKFTDTSLDNKVLIISQPQISAPIITVVVPDLDSKYIYSINPFYWMEPKNSISTSVVGIIQYGTNVPLNMVEVTYETLSQNINKVMKIQIDTAEIEFKVERGYPDMIFKFIDDDRFTEKDNLRAIITRSFDTKDGNRLKWDGSDLVLTIPLNKGEQYGVIKYLFDHHGQDLNYTYILISMTDATPLCKSKKKLDKGMYLVKLDMDLNLFEKENNEYEITIPFRKKVKAEAEISTILHMIFQAPEENNHDPICSIFPTFKMAADPKMYAGCIKSYQNTKEIAVNTWNYYPSNYQEENFVTSDLPNDVNRLIRVHCFHYRDQSASVETEISTKQRYIMFPDNFRYIAVNNITINNLKKYSLGSKLEVKCDRCGKLLKNDLPNGNELYSGNPGIFYTFINAETTNFNIFAVCKEKTDAFCAYTEDFSNDGVALLKYTHTSSNPNEDYGVEEIVDNDYTKLKDTTLLDPGYTYQIISNRGNAFLTKNWVGSIDRVLTKISGASVSCNAVKKGDYVSIKLFIGETQIPFSPKKFTTDNDEAFKEYMSQIGVKATSYKTVTDDQLRLDNEGTLIMHKDMFDKKLFKKNNKMKITMIDLPEDSYIRYENEAKLSPGAIAGIVIAAIVVVVAIVVITLWARGVIC